MLTPPYQDLFDFSNFLEVKWKINQSISWKEAELLISRCQSELSDDSLGMAKLKNKLFHFLEDDSWEDEAIADFALLICNQLAEAKYADPNNNLKNMVAITIAEMGKKIGSEESSLFDERFSLLLINVCSMNYVISGDDIKSLISTLEKTKNKFPSELYWRDLYDRLVREMERTLAIIHLACSVAK